MMLAGMALALGDKVNSAQKQAAKTGSEGRRSGKGDKHIVEEDDEKKVDEWTDKQGGIILNWIIVLWPFHVWLHVVGAMCQYPGDTQ